jgi:hypothetical protein
MLNSIYFFKKLLTRLSSGFIRKIGRVREPFQDGSSAGEASAWHKGHCPPASKEAKRVTRDSRVKGFPNVAEIERPLRRAVLKLRPVGKPPAIVR